MDVESPQNKKKSRPLLMKGIANHAVLCHFIKSIDRFLQ